MLLRVFVCQNCSPDYIFVVFSSSFTLHFCCNEKEPYKLCMALISYNEFLG